MLRPKKKPHSTSVNGALPKGGYPERRVILWWCERDYIPPMCCAHEWGTRAVIGTEIQGFWSLRLQNDGGESLVAGG